MLVVIFIEFNEVLYGGLDYSTLQPRCAPLPRQNYRLLLSICLYTYLQNRDGKGYSTRNRAKERASITV